MKHATLPLCVAFLLCACDKTRPSTPATTSLAQTVAETPPDPDGGEDTPSPLAVKQHMQEHWGLAIVIRDAVIDAALDELPDVAGELADHEPPDALTKYGPQIAAMRTAAESAQRAGTMEAGAQAAAQLAKACGDCHVAAGIQPDLPAELVAPDADETKAHMMRHDHAARDLWAGLVMPSDERWALGVAGLGEKPLKRGDFFEDWEVTDQLVALDDNVHGMGPRLASAATRDERVKLYAELVANCATCHAATAKGPVD